MPRFLSEGLRLVAMCPICHAPEATDAHLLRSDRDSGLMHVTCQTCGHALMAHIQRNGSGVHCIGIATDLTVVDARSSLCSGAVSTEDIFTVHEAVTDGSLMQSVLGPRCA